jgi:hypothetical protein
VSLIDAQGLVDKAHDLAEELLGPVGSRWSHTQGVAARAASAAAAVDEQDRPILVAAAYLHDIGYAEPLRESGFHPLDGARFLQRQGWPTLIAGLVAHHSGARFVAAVRGLSPELLEFDDEAFMSGPLADAIIYADQTTGPDGQPIDLERRMADMLRRHGPDSPNARCHHVRAPILRAAVKATEDRLRAADCPAGVEPSRRDGLQRVPESD